MKSFLYLSIFAITALALGILFYTYFRSMIVERGCAEIAAQSSDYFEGEERINPRYEFDNVKDRCLEDSLAK